MSTNENAEVNAKIGDFGLSIFAHCKINEPLESWQWYTLLFVYYLFIICLLFIILYLLIVKINEPLESWQWD